MLEVLNKNNRYTWFRCVCGLQGKTLTDEFSNKSRCKKCKLLAKKHSELALDVSQREYLFAYLYDKVLVNY